MTNCIKLQARLFLFNANRVCLVEAVFIYPLAVVLCTSLKWFDPFQSNKRSTLSDPVNRVMVWTINVVNIEKHYNRQSAEKGRSCWIAWLLIDRLRDMCHAISAVTQTLNLMHHGLSTLQSRTGGGGGGGDYSDTMLEKFGNAAFILRFIGLLSTLRQTENSFSKTLIKPEEFENTSSVCFGRKTFWKRSFS